MCDFQRVLDWNERRGRGCYNMTNYRSRLELENYLFFDTPTGRIVQSAFSLNVFFSLFICLHPRIGKSKGY